VSPEGLSDSATGSVVRKALAGEVSFKCGYCAPGFAIALTALFSSGQRLDAESIKAALESEFCRCTG
jgi:carbon-monoxide dehydrogenase small subunit